MKATSISLVLATLAMATFIGPVAAAENAVVGTWRITDFSAVNLSTNEVSKPFGDNLIGYIQYSPGGHMLVFFQRGDTEKSHSAVFDDDYRAYVHRSIFGAYAGTYSVDGNKVTHHIVASWRPEWIGGDQVRFFEIAGNMLTIKTAPLISTRNGEKRVVIVTCEKIE